MNMIEADRLLSEEKYNPEQTAQTYTALIRQSEGWWIGWIQEVRGVTCQERTRNALLDTLKSTLRELLEFDVRKCLHRTKSEVESVKTSDLLEFSRDVGSHATESEFEEVRIAL